MSPEEIYEAKKEKRKTYLSLHPEARYALSPANRNQGRKSVVDGPRATYQIIIPEKTLLQLRRVGTDRCRRLLIDFGEKTDLGEETMEQFIERKKNAGEI